MNPTRSGTTGEAAFDLPTRAATAQWGRTLGALLQPGDVIALVGDLGAGKTTLTQAIARGMGITEAVTSPTFTLAHEYAGPTPLFHFDPYRLERGEDLNGFGFEEYFERGGVIIVEWADKVRSLLPPDRLTLTLELPADFTDPDAEDAPRRVTLTAGGMRSLELLRLMSMTGRPTA